MKRKNIFALMAAATALSLASCIEETQPEGSTVTAEQLGASTSGLEAAARGITSQMTEGYLVYGEQVHETDMAYPQFMIAQTEMLGDMYPASAENSGYDWFQNYNTFSRPFGETSYFAYLPWFTLYQFIKTANDVISSGSGATTDEARGYVGAAYAARAFHYFMLTILFEPVENIYTDVSKVKGLTVPKVTEATTGDEAKNNPRLTHDEMVEFILSDLDAADSLLANYTPAKTLPGLAVSYGIRAKIYMWDEQYEKAAEYARMAINASGASPMTEDEWTNPTTGFTTACSSWMWYTVYGAENMRNLCNFVGWMSAEADWGYSSLTQPVIDRALYDKIGRNDFRKNVFLGPESRAKAETCRTSDWLDGMPDYTGLKFRCFNGDYQTYSVGGATQIPIMRVEEMYFIEALANGILNLETGKTLLNSFMQTYRDPDFNCTALDLNKFETELLAQMRVEFWGEGNAFPIAKQLKLGVMQNYEGTNAPADTYKRNCQGIKPNWNLVIPTYEVEANSALVDKNNPDPTNCIAYPSPVGSYSPGNY